MDKKNLCQFFICGDLFVLHNVVNTVAIHVGLKMDNPPDFSVKVEDEHLGPISVKFVCFFNML